MVTIARARCSTLELESSVLPGIYNINSLQMAGTSNTRLLGGSFSVVLKVIVIYLMLITHGVLNQYAIPAFNICVQGGGVRYHIADYAEKIKMAAVQTRTDKYTSLYLS
jgi:hypothetical protein